MKKVVIFTTIVHFRGYVFNQHQQLNQLNLNNKLDMKTLNNLPFIHVKKHGSYHYFSIHNEGLKLGA